MMVEMSATRENSTLLLPYTIREAPSESFDGYPVLWGDLAENTHKLQVGLRECLILDYIPLIRSLVDEIERGRVAFELAAAFHNTLLNMTNQHVPVNDGGLALGQAFVAAAMVGERERRR